MEAIFRHGLFNASSLNISIRPISLSVALLVVCNIAECNQRSGVKSGTANTVTKTEDDSPVIVGSQKAPQDVLPESMLKSRTIGMNIFGNALFENRNGKFQDISDKTGTETFWPWGHSVADLNADGFQDIFVTASMNYPFRYHHNSLLLNDRGERFQASEFTLGVEPRRDLRTATPWFNLDCAKADSSHKLCEGCSGPVTVWAALGTRSVAIFDLDGDGDLDIVSNDFNSLPMVLVSDLSTKNGNLNYLKLRLEGTRSNRDGLGARVQLFAGGQTFTQVQDGQSGYLSQSSLPLYFGLGETKVVDRIEIDWPGGLVQIVRGPLDTNRELAVVEQESSP